MNLRNKIKKHRYVSPHEFSDEIDMIIKSDCKCVQCGESIFDLADFPEIRDGSVYCEDCFDNIFMTVCCVCCESHDIDEHVVNYFVVSKECEEEYEGKMYDHCKAGLYKINERPFYRKEQLWE